MTAVVALAPLALLPAEKLAAAAVLAAALLALAATDLERGLLPDILTLPLMGIGLLLAWHDGAVLGAAIGAAAGWAGFAGLAALYRRMRGREGLGLGDAKLLGALGAWLGWEALPLLTALAAIGALVAASAAARRRGTVLGAADELRFGPFLCLSGWVVFLYRAMRGF